MIPAIRFGPFSGATHHYAPVCLNSLLYRYERDLEHIAHLLGKAQGGARKWDSGRRRAMRRFIAICGGGKDGVFADFDFVHARTSNYVYIASLYPLWAGVASREEAKQMVAKLSCLSGRAGCR